VRVSIVLAGFGSKKPTGGGGQDGTGFVALYGCTYPILRAENNCDCIKTVQNWLEGELYSKEPIGNCKET